MLSELISCVCESVAIHNCGNSATVRIGVEADGTLSHYGCVLGWCNASEAGEQDYTSIRVDVCNPKWQYDDAPAVDLRDYESEIEQAIIDELHVCDDDCRSYGCSAR